MRTALQCERARPASPGECRAKARREGFTISETLIATVVVAVMAGALFGAFSLSFSVMQITRDDLRATQIAMQKMEAIRLFAWSQVLDTNYVKPTFVEFYDPSAPALSSAGSVYRGVVTTSIPADLPEAYQTNMRTITVTVYWTNYNGKKPIVHSRQMQTCVARYGMQNYVWGAL